MLNLPPKCWRDRKDCEPLHAIESFPAGLTEDELFDGLENGTVKPNTFVCCGCVASHNRTIPQDAYRVCWKNAEVDEMGDYDEQDLTHQLAVISQAVAVIAARRVKGGMIEVPTEQGKEERASPSSPAEEER